MAGKLNFILWPILLVGVGSVGWMAYSRASSAAKLESDLAAIAAMDARWQDHARLIDSTPRVALAEQIRSAQALRQEAAALDSAGCAEAAKMHLVASIDAGVSAYLAFMGQTGNPLADLGRSKSERARMMSAVGVCRGLPPVDFSELEM
jgi:hypothetical protein